MRRLLCWRFGTVVLLAVAAGAVALPGPASASPVRYRTFSEHSTEADKSAVANCPEGSRVLGAGGRIEGADGGVALTAVEPDPTLTFVTASAQARTGHGSTPWSVVAIAVCVDSSYDPVLVTGYGSTARCPAGTGLIGAGFRLTGTTDQTFLTGVVPGVDLTSVTIRADSTVWPAAAPVGYAICDANVSNLHMSAAPLLSDTSPKSATAVSTVDLILGMGGEVLGAPSRVFIDMLAPTLDLTEATVRAVRAPLVAKPVIGNPVAQRSTLDDDDEWSIVGYGVSAYYY